MSKYGAIKTVIDGIRFDSKAEARRYNDLLLLQYAGEICGLKVHPKYLIWQNAEKTTAKDRIFYTADFEYVQDGQIVVEDVKGGKATQTAVFKLKKKMFCAVYPHYKFVIVEM